LVCDPAHTLQLYSDITSSSLLFDFSAIARFFGVTLLFLLLLYAQPHGKTGLLRRLELAGAQLASRGAAMLAAVFVGAVALRLAVLPWLPIPTPAVHDEFSYLLMADTFAHGRLANPPHPLWISFETFHVNWLPAYASKYPPAQGAILALGQLLGNPWIGVLLSSAAMCAAIAWMLQAWMPARWALLGGLLVAVKLGVVSYWVNSYWGGCASAIGGALVMGALARLGRRANVRDATLLGVGVALLADSRPYEGLLFCIPVFVALIWWLVGRHSGRPSIDFAHRRKLVLLPLALLMLAFAGWTGYYNWRLTGHATELPYQLNARTYFSTSEFFWVHPKAPLHYNNQQFEDFYNVLERNLLRWSWKAAFQQKLREIHSEFLWPGLLLVVPWAFFALRERKMRLLWITLVVVLAGYSAIIWPNPHYFAPATCLVYALVAQSLRHLRTLRLRGRRIGWALSRAVVFLLLIDAASGVALHSCDGISWRCRGNPGRFLISKHLEQLPGKHLVFVHYGPKHDVTEEWVYNRADIDSSKIVWAREISPGQDARVRAYFHNRQVWVVDADPATDDIDPRDALRFLRPFQQASSPSSRPY
jgi:hypothetical protein